MSRRKKWAAGRDDLGEPLRCVLLVSRNKDNRDVPGYRQRRRASLRGLAGPAPDADLEGDLAAFVAGGVPGELSRCYVSVNARDAGLVRKLLLERLVFEDDLPLAHLDEIACGLAARHECAAERRWLLDVDDRCVLGAVESCLVSECGLMPHELRAYETPHGYGVVCEHGFDARPLYARWPDTVTLKRDDLLCVRWARRT